MVYICSMYLNKFDVLLDIHVKCSFTYLLCILTTTGHMGPTKQLRGLVKSVPDDAVLMLDPLWTDVGSI